MGGSSAWYDAEGDFLEIYQEDEGEYFVDLDDGIFKRVSKDGETSGFSVLNVRTRKHRDLPFDVRFEADPSEA